MRALAHSRAGRARRGGTEVARRLEADWRARAEAARRAVDLVALIGAEVKLERRGGVLVGLCPFHGERSPSFTVYPPSATRAGEAHFHCFGCGAHGDALTWAMRSRRLAFREACDWLLGAPAPRAPHPGPLPGGERGKTGGAAPTNSGAIDGQRREERERQDEADRLIAAGRIWEQSRPIVEGDPVDRYLRGRGLRPIDAAWPEALRHHPGLPYPREYGRYAAMVARVTNARGGMVGVHRTYLAERDGAWTKAPLAAPRLSLGPLKFGAVRLAPEAAHIGLAEGIEDALAAMMLSGLPVWSCINAGKLAAVELEFGIGRVTIFADRDTPRENLPQGVGLHQARRLGARLRAEHRVVEIVWPCEGAKDFNDQLLRLGSG